MGKNKESIGFPGIFFGYFFSGGGRTIWIDHEHGVEFRV
jgi:hypothetical protein